MDGTIVVNYSTDASVGSSADPFVAKVITYIGEKAPTEDQVVDAIIAAFQEDYPTYTTIDSSDYPKLKFQAKYGSLYVTCADSSIASPAEGTAVADAAGLTAFLGGANGTAVLTASVETSTAIGADHPVIVPKDITLTLNGNNNVQSKISGEGKVVIKTGDITGNANIEVADVEIQGGSIDDVPAGMNLTITDNAELKDANAAGSTVTVSENKTLTVSGSTALAADITGAGKVAISGTSVTGGDKVKATGGMVLPNGSSIDKVGAIPLTIGSAASDTASITGAATPSSLTFGDKGVTLTLSTAGALTVPAGATLPNVTVTAGSLTLAGDANVAEGATINVAARVPSRVMRKFVCSLWLNEVSQQ